MKAVELRQKYQFDSESMGKYHALNSQDKIMFLDSSQSCNMWEASFGGSDFSLGSLRQYFNVNSKTHATCNHPSLATNRSTSTKHLLDNKSGLALSRKQPYWYPKYTSFISALFFLGFSTFVGQFWILDSIGMVRWCQLNTTHTPKWPIFPACQSGCCARAQNPSFLSSNAGSTGL